MRKFRPLFVTLIMATLLASEALGVTLFVMQDGSGDFEQIQPALDSVASGDTLIIGPGEYFDSNPTPIPGYAWDVNVFGFVPVAELTIIGAGIDETVIGPMVYEGNSSTFSPKGFVWLGGGALHVRDLTVRNCYEGVHAINGPVFIGNCRFSDNRTGIVWKSDGPGGIVSNCTFFAETPSGPFGVYFLGSGNDILVDNCFFEGVTVVVKSIQSVTFLGCEIRDSVVGLQVENGTRCTLSSCGVFDCTNIGVFLWGLGTYCDMIECEIYGGGTAVKVTSSCEVQISDSILFGGTCCALNFDNSSDSMVVNSSIFPGSGIAVRSYRNPVFGDVVHDLRNNFWGTEDGDEIQALILDGTNGPDNASTVLFEPFVGGPVATRETTLDGVKAMFR